MSTAFTDKDTYQDIFDPEGYLNTYYNPKSGILVVDGFLEFALKKLHEAFASSKYSRYYYIGLTTV